MKENKIKDWKSKNMAYGKACELYVENISNYTKWFQYMCKRHSSLHTPISLSKEDLLLSFLGGFKVRSVFLRDFKNYFHLCLFKLKTQAELENTNQGCLCIFEYSTYLILLFWKYDQPLDGYNLFMLIYFNRSIKIEILYCATWAYKINCLWNKIKN